MKVGKQPRFQGVKWEPCPTWRHTFKAQSGHLQKCGYQVTDKRPRVSSYKALKATPEILHPLKKTVPDLHRSP